jgi:iron:rusticyanin reductase
MYNHTRLKGLLSLCVMLFSFTLMSNANAVPSYARQTGLNCGACHSAFPQLNAFGRSFKLQGYTLTTENQVKGKNLGIDLGAPLSMMIQTTWSKIKKTGDPTQDDSRFDLPSQLSIFYAGRISDKLGAFAQITYTPDDDHFGMDNTDIRYADTTKVGGSDLIWGLSLNNNPTVQDPWNSTPAWGFPWFEAGYGYDYPDPMIASLGGSVAGGSAYGFWDDHLYTELGVYEAANTNNRSAGGEAIKGAAPYWRLAYAGDLGGMNWELGTFGMRAKIPTNGFDAGQPLDKLTDAAIDGQLQWVMGDDTITLDANFVHEKQKLEATAPGLGSQHLNTMKADITWYSHQTWGITAGYRGAMSSSDAIVYGGDGTTGKQNADAWQLQLDYTPWLNTRFALQYTDYQKLNGETSGASDSNQIMLGAWFLF